GVSKGKVMNLLNWVKLNIQTATGEGQDVVLSEVVLLYYQGREVIARDGHFLLTDDTLRNEDLSETGVACDAIGQLFRDARGAQVVMLDVERAQQARAEALEEDRLFQNKRLGVFHTFWTAGGAAPANRLLSLLQQSWPQANNLGALARQVDALRQQVAPQMRFFPYLPGDLMLLEFGG